jgi:hypothetical protein
MPERLIETGRCYGREINVEKSELMRISRQSRVQTEIFQKHPENVEYYKYFDSMIISDAMCTCEIKPSTAVAKAAFKRNQILFTSKLDLKYRKKELDCYIWNSFAWF